MSKYIKGFENEIIEVSDYGEWIGNNYIDYKYEYQEKEKEINLYLKIIEEKEQEIEKLNNIINELEKYIDEDDWTSVNGEIAVRLIKLKLQELKGSDKE